MRSDAQVMSTAPAPRRGNIRPGPPGDGYGDWIARQGGMILAADHEPGALLAVLEVLLGP